VKAKRRRRKPKDLTAKSRSVKGRVVRKTGPALSPPSPPAGPIPVPYPITTTS
jgi:hypothetical protein